MFIIDDTKKEMLKSLVRNGQNVLITGATGSGKTTFCNEVGTEMGMDVSIINCGSTQDARSALLGYFTLEDGNTIWTDSDFIKAIQKPNSLIVLDELSRASDDAYNIIFPLLDFRRSITIEEKNGESRSVNVADGVRFVATANVGLEYSATRSIDRALQDRFVIFNLEYLKGKQLRKYIAHAYDKTTADACKGLISLYDYSHQLFDNAKITTKLSPRAILQSVCLVGQYKDSEILDNVILSIFQQDSSNILNDANILREYADSLGIYDS